MVLALLLACVVYSSPVAAEPCDMVEVNHFQDAQDRPIFSQGIFWKYDHEANVYRCRAWRMVENTEITRNQAARVVDVRWYDSSANISHRVTSRLYKETWTTRDPERDDRKLLNERDRESLIHRIADVRVPTLVPVLPIGDPQ